MSLMQDTDTHLSGRIKLIQLDNLDKASASCLHHTWPNDSNPESTIICLWNWRVSRKLNGQWMNLTGQMDLGEDH